MNPVIRFSDLPWESPAPGLRVKSIQEDGKQLRLVEFSEGFVEPNWCIQGHSGYVLEGAMELDLNGKRIRLEAGDGLFLPAGEATRHRHIRSLPRVLLFLVEDLS